MVKTSDVVLALLAYYIVSQEVLGLINLPMPSLLQRKQTMSVKLTSPLTPGSYTEVQTYTPSSLQVPFTVDSKTGIRNIVLPASRPLVNPGTSYQNAPVFKGGSLSTMSASNIIPFMSVSRSTNLGSTYFDRTSDPTRNTNLSGEPRSIVDARAGGKDQITSYTPAVQEQIRPYTNIYGNGR